MPLVNLAHAMAELDPVVAATAFRRPAIHREDHGVALDERDDGGAGLDARALLGQHELAACKVATGIGQQRRDLEREDVFAVEVLMQAVVVARSVLKEKRRRTGLSRGMAAL